MVGHGLTVGRPLLDEMMPRYDVGEVHDVWVPASPQAAYAAVKSVTPREVRLLRPLMAIRTLPSRLRGRPAVDPAAPCSRSSSETGSSFWERRPASSS